MSRRRLEELAPEQFSSILILADEGATFATAGSVDAGADASADSDSRNLATLLLLRRACSGFLSREGTSYGATWPHCCCSGARASAGTNDRSLV